MATKTKKSGKKTPLLILLVAVAVVFVAYFGIRQIMIVQEKAKFEAAAVELEGLRKQIEEKIGKAGDSRTEKSCGYSSAKFSKGTLACFVTFSLTNNDTELARVNGNLATISSLFNSPLRKSSIASKNLRFDEYSSGEGRQILSQAYKSKEGLSCLISYGYATQKKYSYDTVGFTINTSCYGQAIAAHYPLD